MISPSTKEGSLNFVRYTTKAMRKPPRSPPPSAGIPLQLSLPLRLLLFFSAALHWGGANAQSSSSGLKCYQCAVTRGERVKTSLFKSIHR